MDLYLIRHAQSQNNAVPESDRVPDPALTDVGHDQAGFLGEWVASLGLTRVVTSPFLRTLETAERIRRTTKLAPEVRAELHEQGGCFSGFRPESTVGQPGLNRAGIEAKFAGYKVADGIGTAGWWKSRPYETRQEAAKRAERLFHATLEEFGPTSERVAFVMHADIELLLLEQFHDQPLSVPCNASVTHLEISSAGAKLADFNFIGHLPENLITS